MCIDKPLVRYRVVEASVLRQIDARVRGRLTLRAVVEAFIDDMHVEKPVPQDVRRRGIAYSRFTWARYSGDGRTRYRFALGQLVRAVRDDPTLAWRASRQVAKLTRNALLSARGS